MLVVPDDELDSGYDQAGTVRALNLRSHHPPPPSIALPTHLPQFPTLTNPLPPPPPHLHSPLHHHPPPPPLITSKPDLPHSTMRWTSQHHSRWTEGKGIWGGDSLRTLAGGSTIPKDDDDNAHKRPMQEAECPAAPAMPTEKYEP
ncbi:hypothetical protein CPC08DRAFT_824665 [Agrocybe pediades]|nr:hypothetical protein CPC08DRAFT_824665 [Agrocybe pediades]